MVYMPNYALLSTETKSIQCIYISCYCVLWVDTFERASPWIYRQARCALNRGIWPTTAQDIQVTISRRPSLVTRNITYGLALFSLAGCRPLKSWRLSVKYKLIGSKTRHNFCAQFILLHVTSFEPQQQHWISQCTWEIVFNETQHDSSLGYL